MKPVEIAARVVSDCERAETAQRHRIRLHLHEGTYHAEMTARLQREQCRTEGARAVLLALKQASS